MIKVGTIVRIINEKSANFGREFEVIELNGHEEFEDFKLSNGYNYGLSELKVVDFPSNKISLDLCFEEFNIIINAIRFIELNGETTDGESELLIKLKKLKKMRS